MRVRIRQGTVLKCSVVQRTTLGARIIILQIIPSSLFAFIILHWTWTATAQPYVSIQYILYSCANVNVMFRERLNSCVCEIKFVLEAIVGIVVVIIDITIAPNVSLRPRRTSVACGSERYGIAWGIQYFTRLQMVKAVIKRVPGTYHIIYCIRSYRVGQWIGRFWNNNYKKPTSMFLTNVFI